jgi:hypothetical protein
VSVLDAFVGYLNLGLGSQKPRGQDRVMPRGESATGTITVYKDDGTLADLSGGALVITIENLFAREMDFVSAPSGTARFDISTGDTWFHAEVGYPFDVVFIDNAGTYGVVGGRYQVVRPSRFILTEAITENPPVVSPAPSQTALAQGPPGGTYSGSALPSPSASYRGFIFAVLGGAGVADAAYICLKLSDDSYGWFEVGSAP